MRYRTGRLCHIKMELVAQVGHPRGDRTTGYELVLPLDPDGHIDATSWLDDPRACRVRRFRQGSAEKQGTLMRTPRGRWYFDYGSGQDAQQDQGFDEDRFVPGQFIAICEEDGKLLTYRIASIEVLSRAASRQMYAASVVRCRMSKD